MKLINESVFKFDSVNYGVYMTLFLSVLYSVLQQVFDAQVLSEPYQSIISAVLVVLAVIVGKKKYQPELHEINSFVTLTAGHSNVDPGAVNGKFNEAELVTKFRNAVAYYLMVAGVEIKTDGVGSDNQNLNTAIKLIKGSDVAVEFHMNAAANKSAYGIETIALQKDKKLAQELSKAVADTFKSKLRGDAGWIDQSQSARGKLGFISNGGLIVELGFISNEAELAQFNSKYWQAAKAVAQILISADQH